MARFLLESNREFCAIFRRQVQKSCQETAGRLLIEDGVVVIYDGKSASFYKSRPPGRKTPDPLSYLNASRGAGHKGSVADYALMWFAGPCGVCR